jgi:hypothetical protein
MKTLREAAQQALEALDSEHPDIQLRAAVALRDALAQQEQEQVAMCRTWHKGSDQHAELLEWSDALEALPDGEHLLYTHPPRREWQSLSDEEIKNAVEASADFWATSRGWITSVARAIERALKEKNNG